MNVFGIVAEYNPFHNGHKFQVDTALAMGATHLVAVMSPNFTQRGEPSVLDKFCRSEVAVRCGVDLVLELPTYFALSSAEKFAFGAIGLLDRLNVVDCLIFGTETDDVELLNDVVGKLETDVFNESLKEILKRGYSFPRARQMALEHFFDQGFCKEKIRETGVTDNKEIVDVIFQPNNILALEYLKWLKRLHSKIKPLAVKRVGTMHDSKVVSRNMFLGSVIGGDIAGCDVTSAFNLREMVKVERKIESWQPFVPSEAYQVYEKAFKMGAMPALEVIGERAVLAKLRSMTIEEIKLVADVSEGLENRILSAIKSAQSLDEVYQNIKTKRYTMSRIRRIIYNLFLNLNSENAKNLPNYVRVLACNKRGLELIARIKKESNVKIDCNLNKLSQLSDFSKVCAEIEVRAGDMYGLFCPKVLRCGFDLTKKFFVF